MSAPVIDGDGALRIGVEGTDGAFAMAEHAFPVQSGGTLYGRAMLWLDASSEFERYLVVVQLDAGDDSGAEKVSIDLLPGDGIALTATTANPSVSPEAPPAAVRREQWMCLRFEIDIDDRNGAMRLLDGPRQIAAATGFDTLPKPSGFHRLLVGAAAPGRVHGELLFDAVALAPHPLACP